MSRRQPKTREDALAAVVTKTIKAINTESRNLDGYFVDFVHDAAVRVIALFANRLDLDQHILSCDIAEERYRLKKREESSDG